MPEISYPIQRSVPKIVRGRKCWYYEYEHILVDVNDAVAEFFADEDKKNKRYKWKIDKQKQAAKIYTEFSLDEIVQSDDDEDFPVAEMVEDTVHSENRDPLEMIIEREEEEQAAFDAILDKLHTSILTKKQYAVWQYNRAGYGFADIARMLNIDESSARERLRNAENRIEKFWKKHHSEST